MASWLSFAVVALSFFQLIPSGLCSWEGEWDPDELDIFDLVEEIGENFYDIMQIDQSASQSELRRAYRKLSLQLHPDKSDDPNAAEKFRKMATVYEVLKDEGKRRIYDEVLVEGLPDWSQSVYYYRKVRKMGFMEVSLILLGITSIGHYLYGWANYAEKKLVMQDLLERKKKKEQRKMRQIKALHAKQVLEAELEAKEAEAQESKPKFKNLLPFLLIRHLVLLLVALWAYLYNKVSRKDTDSCTDEKKFRKKQENGKSRAPKSPAAKRKNGKVRARRAESESSESEFEKKEEHMGAVSSSTGREGRNRLESVDGSEDEKIVSRTTGSQGPTESPRNKGEGKKSNGNSTSKQSPRVGSKDGDKKDAEENIPLKAKLQNNVGGRKQAKKGNGESEEKNGSGARKEKKEPEKPKSKGKDVKPGESVKNVNGKNTNLGEKNSERGRGTDISGAKGKSGAAEGRSPVDDTKRKGTEAVLEAKEPSEEPPTTEPSNGWKTAGSSRSKVQKKKVVETPKESLQKASRTERTGESTPPREVRNGSPSTNETWTQFQQDMLEKGLAQYNTSCVDRWANISKMVPGKSMDECKFRCIQLYEELKSKRSSS